MRHNVQSGSRQLCWSGSTTRCRVLPHTVTPPRTVSRYAGSALAYPRSHTANFSRHVLFRRSASTAPQTSDVPPTFTIRRQQVGFADPIKEVNLDSPIRQELRAWHLKRSQEWQQDLSTPLGGSTLDATINPSARPGDLERIRNLDEHDSNMVDEFGLTSDAKDLESLDPHHRILRRGDLVEIHLADITRDPVIAVFVRRLGSSFMSQFFTSTGRWLHAVESAATFAVPNFMKPELIDKMIPYLPSVDDEATVINQGNLFDISVPREASSPVVSRLLNFQGQSQELYRRYAARLDRAHELIADEQDLKFATLSQITRKLLNRTKDAELEPVELFTVRLALMRSGFAFGYDRRHHRLTGFVHIRSKAHLYMISRVRGWMRQYRDELARQKADSNPLDLEPRTTGGRIVHDFVKKAKAVIQESRRDRDPTQMGCLGPSKVRLEITQDQSCVRYRTAVEWTANEQLLIKFMEAWGSHRSLAGLPNLEAQPPMILKATGMYENYLLMSGTGFLFLQEIGYISPWMNRVQYDENLLIPSADHSQMLANMASDIAQPRSETEATGLMISDTLKNVRRERGDGFTYCLDGSRAHEIDDGISIDPTADGSTWVHVDVANPTAFLDKDSIVAKFAQHMTETIYLPDHSHMMIPSWITQRYFSLDEGRPCIRFSARLDEDGAVLEYDVTAGHSRNVKFIDPDQVDKALGIAASTEGGQRVLCVGGTPPEPQNQSKKMTTAAEITPKMRDDLERLISLANRRGTLRGSRDGVNFATSDRDIRVWVNQESSGMGWEGTSVAAARLIEGDPIIQINTREYSPAMKLGGLADTKDMVQEYMLLASYVAGKWMHDRGIPTIYRGSLPALDNSRETAAQYFARVVAPLAQRNGGYVRHHLALEYLRRSNPSTMTMDPLNHDQLGLTHYTRVTSPLRRYCDMLSHWQIGAALVEEHRTGRRLQPHEAGAVMPFTRKTLEAMTPMLRAREDRIKRAKRWGINFWTAQLMFRAFYYGEMELPKTLTAFITQPTTSLGTPCMFKEYEFPCVIKDIEDGRLGDEYEVQIVKADVYNTQIEVRPIRLISRAEQIPE